jgi:hypothetical protein
MALWNTTPANTTETMIADNCAAFIFDSCECGRITPASMRLVEAIGYSIESWLSIGGDLHETALAEDHEAILMRGIN